MKTIILIFGIACIFFGGLWLLQGLGLVITQPIFCAADCAAVQGIWPPLAVAGAVFLVIGALTIRYARRR